MALRGSCKNNFAISPPLPPPPSFLQVANGDAAEVSLDVEAADVREERERASALDPSDCNHSVIIQGLRKVCGGGRRGRNEMIMNVGGEGTGFVLMGSWRQFAITCNHVPFALGAMCTSTTGSILADAYPLLPHRSFPPRAAAKRRWL